jgi:hypothetical protein
MIVAERTEQAAVVRQPVIERLEGCVWQVRICFTPKKLDSAALLSRMSDVTIRPPIAMAVVQRQQTQHAEEPDWSVSITYVTAITVKHSVGNEYFLGTSDRSPVKEGK